MNDTATKSERLSESGARLRSYGVEAEARRRSCLEAERGWSWSRLACFFTGFLVWFWLDDANAALAVTGIAGVLFVVSVRRHLRASADREFADRLLLMIAESRQRFGGKVVTIRSNHRPVEPDPTRQTPESVLDLGDTWWLSEQERDDLDLYADPVGVFGLLNRASTNMGARRLRDMCEHPCLSPGRIGARQACVRLLDDQMEARLRMMAGVATLRGRDEPLGSFLSAVRSATGLPSPGRIRMLRLWSIPSGLFVCIALPPAVMGIPGWLGALLMVVLVNAALSFRMHGDLDVRLHPWRDVAHAVHGLLFACEHAGGELPDDTELARLRDCFADAIAPDVLPALKWRLDLTNTGGTIHAILNVVFFYDLHTADAILNRVVPHRETILGALGALADLEAMTSLASFAFEQPVAVYASVAGEPVLSIEGGVHPLVAPGRIVGNDVHLSAGSRVRVITGSNMAGKSTYLRMVGVNTLLAQLGGVVTARRVRFAPVRLVSDLRIRDDLSKEESYFMAEVRQIRRMLLPPPSDAPLLGLIDELFRGTNSVERIAASVAVVRQLMESDHFFVVATHEHRLTELADGLVATNHHFDEELGSDGPVFEYALHPGPARMRNALRILDREGFPQAVLDKAREWMAKSADDGGRLDDAGD